MEKEQELQQMCNDGHCWGDLWTIAVLYARSPESSSKSAFMSRLLKKELIVLLESFLCADGEKKIGE